MSTDFATFTRDCIAWLDDEARDLVMDDDETYFDAPTPIYDETVEFLAEWARPSVTWRSDFTLDDDWPWLPLLGWLLFAGLVALLVWAVST